MPTCSAAAGVQNCKQLVKLGAARLQGPTGLILNWTIVLVLHSNTKRECVLLYCYSIDTLRFKKKKVSETRFFETHRRYTTDNLFRK